MQIDQHTLIRYFFGHASEEEKEGIHQWIENDETNRQWFVRERICFDASVIMKEPGMIDKKRPFIRPWLSRCLKIAASLLLLWGMSYWHDTHRMTQLAETYQCIYVPPGNRTNLSLSDGTNVWLSANTTFRYPIIFSEKNREVTLDGEAYFQVAKDKKPFLIKTDKYAIEVLGTTLM